MSAFSLNIHTKLSRNIRAEVDTGENVHWVTLSFDADEVTIYTTTREQALFIAAGFRRAFPKPVAEAAE